MYIHTATIYVRFVHTCIMYECNVVCNVHPHLQFTIYIFTKIDVHLINCIVQLFKRTKKPSTTNLLHTYIHVNIHVGQEASNYLFLASHSLLMRCICKYNAKPKKNNPNQNEVGKFLHQKKQPNIQ